MEQSNKAMHHALDKYLRVHQGQDEHQTPITDELDDSRHFSIRESIENFHGLYIVTSSRKLKASRPSQSIEENPFELSREMCQTPAESDDENAIYEAEKEFGDVDGEFFTDKEIAGMMRMDIQESVEKSILLGNLLRCLSSELNFTKSQPHLSSVPKKNTSKASLSKMKRDSRTKSIKDRQPEPWLKVSLKVVEKREIPSPELSKPRILNGNIFPKNSPITALAKSKSHSKSNSLKETDLKLCHKRLETVHEAEEPSYKEKLSSHFRRRMSLVIPEKTIEVSNMIGTPVRTSAKIEKDIQPLYKVTSEVNIEKIRDDIHGYLGNIESNIKLLVEKCDDTKKHSVKKMRPVFRERSISYVSTGITETEKNIPHMIDTDSEEAPKKWKNRPLSIDKQTNTDDLINSNQDKLTFFFKKIIIKAQNRQEGALKQRPNPSFKKQEVRYQIPYTSPKLPKINLFMKRSSKQVTEQGSGCSKPRFSKLEDLLNYSSKIKSLSTNSKPQYLAQSQAESEKKKDDLLKKLFMKRYKAKTSSLGHSKVSLKSDISGKDLSVSKGTDLKLKTLFRNTILGSKNQISIPAAKVISSKKIGKSLDTKISGYSVGRDGLSVAVNFSTRTKQLEKALSQIKKCRTNLRGIFRAV